MAGLIVTYSQSFVNSVSRLLNAYTECELGFNSVERILEYCDTLPQERYEPTAPVEVPPGWPTQGGLSVTNLTMRYMNTLPSTPPALVMVAAAVVKVALPGLGCSVCWCRPGTTTVLISQM